MPCFGNVEKKLELFWKPKNSQLWHQNHLWKSIDGSKISSTLDDIWPLLCLTVGCSGKSLRTALWSLTEKCQNHDFLPYFGILDKLAGGIIRARLKSSKKACQKQQNAPTLPHRSSDQRTITYTRWENASHDTERLSNNLYPIFCKLAKYRCLICRIFPNP